MSSHSTDVTTRPASESARRRVFVVGATGGVGARLVAALVRSGHAVSGMHRSADQAAAVRDAGASPVRGDLVTDPVGALATLMADHDAVVFAAGAGGGGEELTTAIDERGAQKAVDAAAAAGVRRFVLISVFMDAWRGAASPGTAFEHYMAAKRAADAHLAATELDFLIVRPGTLTDSPGSGHIDAGIALPYGEVPRDDVAAFVAAALSAPRLGRTALEVTSGEVPVEDAVARVQPRDVPSGAQGRASRRPTTVLIVLTSHDQLGDTGRKTGFWLEELAAPYYVLRDAGVQVVLASPAGGQPPLDPASNEPDFQTEQTRRFEVDPEAGAALAATVRLDSVSAEDFDAVFYPGGHGPLWDLADDERSRRLIEDVLRAGKPVALVCHAPGVLRDVRAEDGAPLVRGKRVTGFANTEEEGVGLVDVVPFLVQDMLEEQGGHYSKGPDWESYVLQDGLLITGQNPHSSGAAAAALVAQLVPTSADSST